MKVFSFKELLRQLNGEPESDTEFEVYDLFDQIINNLSVEGRIGTALADREGASIELIRESLGHQYLQTTEAYLDSFEDSTRRMFTEMLVPK